MAKSYNNKDSLATTIYYIFACPTVVDVEKVERFENDSEYL